MGALNLQEWNKLPISLAELCINTTLRCGQSFRWRKSEEGVWSMALHGRIIRLYQDPDNLYYRSTFPTTEIARPISSTTNASSLQDDTLPLLQHYLNLGPNLTDLYAHWSANDANFKRKAPKFTGIRILKQDAWEALVGFICSSNNNIIRISQMVDKLCRTYGPLLGRIDDHDYYDFPKPADLANSGVEQKLRELGFGYRAKYIYKTACMIAEKDDDWLDGLRNPESPAFGKDPVPGGAFVDEGREGYRLAHEELLALQGVGPKVADCVCLMGLGWGEAVPVDTHVWQIAQRDYKFGKSKHTSVTKATYDAVANKFRSLWGQEAGWAQSVLFTANLKAFSERLVAKTEVKEEIAIKEDPDAVKIEEDESAEAETIIKTDKVLVKGIKREADDKDQMLVETKHNVIRKSKRAKKA
ncbi:hypothetical protein AAFC00_007023 [Neodothiora populina]|uniref:DNA-(apurinic or apyrimidinic site) lyase n=1 Tax=Neodothiora populina TaxID=2781224 RepID=A0ABR3PC08_9PEZI